MMMFSVFLLLALPALCLTSPLDTENDMELIDDLSGTEIPVTPSGEMYPTLVTVVKFRRKEQAQSSSIVQSGDGSNLEWVPWRSPLPNGAVSIYNDYVGRTEYVCKYKCHAGFYDPNKTDPKCYYPNQKKEHAGFPFDILVNRDNFEILEWKGGSYGSVPKNSVRTCPDEDIYVGKNEYGLGKVVTEDKVFYLPWKGYEYRYSKYQVLTVSEDIISQEIYDVRYNIDKSEILDYPPEIIRESTMQNQECHSVVKTDTLTEMDQVTHRWNSSLSVKRGVKTTIKAGLPLITSNGIDISFERTVEYSKGNTVVETITDTVSVELTAPPNKFCTIQMMRYKSKVTIPFTALIKRTYGNGDVHTVSMTGTYSGMQVGEVKVLLSRCELLDDSTCT
ncbi:natterin-3-like isoform X2 [Notolabrus celidotus]|uniref:natterin-3-like isoform X1 n=2 Tax=Notolabrus celidotus TaxID=1203425 RepID=UPI00148F8124|nr:natterin-3-like isoform X1 [Notolabrus celidotus]XP_034548366.1 natterin-3-like isoform X2 [Notolabrus celidotus]